MVEALLLGGGVEGGGGKPLPKDEAGARECSRNKLKALVRLLGRWGVKAVKALPGIIGVILSWILNKAAEVVGWVFQNLWALVIGVGELLYTYVVTKK